MAEGQIKHVADHEALRDILGGQGPLGLQVVPILNLSHAPSASSLQPGRERVCVREKLCVGIGHQHGTAASEAPHDGCLQGVVIAAAATLPVEVQARVLREGPIKLTLYKPHRDRRARLTRGQTSRKIHAEGIVCHKDGLRNRNRLTGRLLLRRLSNETVWYLVDVGIELRQVHAMSPSVSHVDEETRGQLALKIQIPLLHGPILLDGEPCCREALLSENVSRRSGRESAPSRRLRVSAGWDDQRAGGAKRTRRSAAEVSKARPRQRAVAGVRVGWT